MGAITKICLRSWATWAYILLHYLPPRVGELLVSGEAVSYSFIILRNFRQRDDSPIKVAVVPLPHPSRHIIPPSRLAELFDTADISQAVPASSATCCEPSTFTSLTPRPRSRHTFGGKSEDFLQWGS